LSTIQANNIVVANNNSSKFREFTQTDYFNRLKSGPFNEQIYLNTTRTALSSVVTNSSLWSVTYNKLSSTSILCLEGYLHFRENVNAEVGLFCKYGTSSNTYIGFPYMAVGENSATASDPSVDTIQYVISYISGYTTTGSQTFTIGWSSYNGTANTPSSVWNPNSSDEPRTRPDSGSFIRLWEIEP